MIPFVAVVSVPDRRSHTFRLWIPLFLVWLLVLPLGLLLLPAVFIGGLVCRVNPFRALSVVWQILERVERYQPGSCAPQRVGLHLHSLGGKHERTSPANSANAVGRKNHGR